MVIATVLQYLKDPPLTFFIILSAAAVIYLFAKLRRDHFYCLIISIGLSFILCERALRYLKIGHFKATTVLYEEEKVFRGKFDYPYYPNSRLVYRYPDNPRNYFDENNEVIGNINSKGFRGKERDFAKPDRVVRISLLGDSFALGAGVRDEDTLSVNLERELGRKFQNIEVLNFGVTGSNTKYQIKLLRRYVLSFNPDIVLIVFFLNDTGRGATIKFLSPPRYFKRIRSYSFFINALFTSIKRIYYHNLMMLNYYEGYKDNSRGWKKVKRSLKNGKELADHKGFEFVVAIYPVLFQLDDTYPFKNIVHTIENFCQSENIRVISLLDGFLGREDSSLWVHPADQHPNEFAQRIAGKKLAEYIIDEGLIKPAE